MGGLGSPTSHALYCPKVRRLSFLGFKGTEGDGNGLPSDFPDSAIAMALDRELWLLAVRS